MRAKSFLPFVALAAGCVISACGGSGSSGSGGSGNTQSGGANQLSQSLLQTASLDLNSQGMRDISQGCTSVGTSSFSNAPVRSQPSGFVASFQEDGAFALKTASGQQVLGGAWRSLDANRVELNIDGSPIQLDVAVNGNSLITSCTPTSAATADDGVPISENPVRSLMGTAPASSSDPTNNSTSNSTGTSGNPLPSVPNSTGTSSNPVPGVPSEWVGTGEISPTGCPSYVYLQPAAATGIFTNNGAYPAFKLSPESSSADGTSCTYTRPTDNPSWAEFVAARFPSGSTCVPHGVDFQCTGASTEIVSCPESIAIGGITFVSYGDYGSSRLLPVPSSWHVEGDHQILRHHINATLWERYGPEGTPGMFCNYSDFSVVRLTR